MRHSENCTETPAETLEILTSCDVLHLAVSGLSGDAAGVYSVPVNFVHREGMVYFHSALKGRKIEALRQNSAVSFSAVKDYDFVPGETACRSSTRFRSVVGFGRAEFIEDEVVKLEILDLLTTRYAGKSLPVDPRVVKKTAVIGIHVDEMTGVVKGWK